jgi:hypothetical protein
MTGRGTACNDEMKPLREYSSPRSTRSRSTIPNRNASSRASLLRALRAGVVLGLPLSAAVAACAGPKKIDVDPSREISFGDAGVSDKVTPQAEARCGDGAIQCGTPARGSSDEPGCCPVGNVCTAEKTCAPTSACKSNQECSGDTVCGGSNCNPWSNLAQANRGFDLGCRDAIDLPSLKPLEVCSWPGATPPADYPEAVQVIGTPMVADFDFDKNPGEIHPSIVFISYADPGTASGVLRVIDGATCQLQFSAASSAPFIQDISPAIGDVDGDKRPDIVVADLSTLGTSRKAGVAVYSVEGNGFKQLARQTGSSTTPFSRISLADVDGLEDGLPEIITDTGIFAVKVGGAGGLSGVVEKRGFDDDQTRSLSLREPPVVEDVTGDQRAEIITPQGIFNWDEEKQDLVVTAARAQPLYNPPGDGPDPGLSFIGTANLVNIDRNALQRDSIEMVTIGANKMLVQQVDGAVLLNVSGSGMVGGPPVIADFDADGRMEFASPGFDQISAFDLDCVSNNPDVQANPQNCKNPKGPNPQGLLWTQTEGIHGASSGASVFDFDGDERAEVVYADQCYLRIMDGATGTVLFSVARSSTTRFDYPVIADVDGDGHTEIVTAQNDHTDNGCSPTDAANHRETVNFKATHGVTVWSDAVKSIDKRWAGSRPMWNEYSYSINNVNDDGTIPAMNEVSSMWNAPDQYPNSLRQNVQGKTGISLQRPDLTVSASPMVKCQRGAVPRATLSANLCNRGLAPVPVGTVNVKMAIQSAPASALCEVANKTQLASGKCEPISCDLAVPKNPDNVNIVVSAEPTSGVAECTGGVNDTAVITNVYCSGQIQ